MKPVLNLGFNPIPMNILFTIGAFVVVFSILVLVHEFGHFIAAKRSGIKVEEFGIGFPPRIWKKKKGETLYSIGAIPFGGFVRLFGMESSKGVSKKNVLKSFSHRNMRTRAKVMVAGVFMNFLLAWVLISFGFMFGMEPLLTADDVLPAVNSGVIKLKEGPVVKVVAGGGMAEGFGFQIGDTIVSVNNKEVSDPSDVADLLANPIGRYEVARGGEILNYEVTEQNVIDYKEVASLNGKKVLDENILGLGFYNLFSFPRVRIYEIDKESPFYKAGLRAGDVIVSVNDQQVYSVNDYLKLTDGINQAVFTVYRDGNRQDLIIPVDARKQVIVTGVVKGKSAEKAGLIDRDIIVSVNGKKFNNPEDLVKFITENDEQALLFAINRDGTEIYKEITPEAGKVGVYLSGLFTPSANGFSLYDSDQLTSVTAITNEKYPFYTAPWHALKEVYRTAKITGVMFVDFVRSFVSSGEISEGVAGPVGIAQMTGAYVKEGFNPLIRFIALLSISLGVLNILPFPALDGGKLLFILIEFVLGRPIPAKWENYVHMLGYALIMLLIIAVTYQDIVRAIV